MKKLTLILCLSFISSLAFADSSDPNKGSSKQNPKHEAQSEGNVAIFGNALWTVIKKLGILITEEGTIQMGYHNISSDGGSTAHSADVSIETSLAQKKSFWFKKEHCKYYDRDEIDAEERFAKRTNETNCYFGETQYVPIEFRFRLRDGKDFNVRDFKVGAVRWLHERSGLTTQLISYVYKNYDHGLGNRHSVELVNLTFNDVVWKSSTVRDVFTGKQVPVVEVIFKARAGVGFGSTFNVHQSIKDAVDAQGISAPRGMGTDLTSSTSLGVQFTNRLLVDVYAGYERSNTDTTTDPLGTAQNNWIREHTLRHKYWGIGTKATITKNVKLNGSLQWNRYNNNISLQTPENEDNDRFTVPGARNRINDTTGMVNVELSW